MNITVNAISATPVLANEQEVIVKGEKDKVPGTPNGTNDTADAVGVPYTGKAIVPEMKYDQGEGRRRRAHLRRLPASAYEYVVTDAKGKVVSRVVDPDTYTVKVKDKPTTTGPSPLRTSRLRSSTTSTSLMFPPPSGSTRPSTRPSRTAGSRATTPATSSARSTRSPAPTCA